jgi:hypothetical protein
MSTTVANIFASLRKKNAVQTTTKGLILVAGEQVQLNEAKFNPQQYTDRVSFKEKYFPVATNNELVDAVRVFDQMFGGPSPMTLSNPMPPCDPADMAILMEGLNTRFTTLADEIEMLEGIQEDTDTLRTKIRQINQLKGFIENAETNRRKKMCNMERRDGSVGFDEGDDAANERMRGLLRKFATLALQNQTPLELYKDTTADAKRAVDILGKNPVSHAQLTKYLDNWETLTRSKIPRSLAEVLSATGNTPGAIEKAVASARAEDAAAAVAATVTPTAGGGLQEGGSIPEVAQIISSGQPPKTMVPAIVSAVTQKLNEYKRTNSEISADNNLKETRIEDLNRQLRIANEALQKSQASVSDLLDKNKKAEEEVIQTTRSNTEKGELLNLLKTQYTSALDTANRELQECELKRQEVASALADAQKELTTTQQVIADANVETTRSKSIAESSQKALDAAEATVLQKTQLILALEQELAKKVAALEGERHSKTIVPHQVPVKGGGDSTPDPSLLAEIKGLESEVASLTSELAAERKDKDDLVSNLEKEKQNAAMAVAERDTSASAWKEQMQVLQGLNATLQGNTKNTSAEELLKLKEKHRTLSADSNKKDAENAELRAKVSSLESSVKLANSSSNQQMAVMKSQVDNLTKEIQASAEANKIKLENLEKNKTSLNAELRKSTEGADKLNGLLMLAKQNFAALTRTLKNQAAEDVTDAERERGRAVAAAAAAKAAGKSQLAAAEEKSANAAAKEAGAAKAVVNAPDNVSQIIAALVYAERAAKEADIAEEKADAVEKISSLAPKRDEKGEQSKGSAKAVLEAIRKGHQQSSLIKEAAERKNNEAAKRLKGAVVTAAKTAERAQREKTEESRTAASVAAAAVGRADMAATTAAAAAAKDAARRALDSKDSRGRVPHRGSSPGKVPHRGSSP